MANLSDYISSVGNVSNTYLTSTYVSNTTFQTALANTNAYIDSKSLTIAQANTSANTEVYTNITTLQFDEDSGFDVTNPETGVAKVAMNSTFKYWQVNGNTQLTASGLDTVNFISGQGITLSANGSTDPQSFTISTEDVYASNSALTLTNLAVDDRMQVANVQSYVTTQINNLVDGAPGALDTLNELAAALGDDSNFAATITTSLASKASNAAFQTALANTNNRLASLESTPIATLDQVVSNGNTTYKAITVGSLNVANVFTLPTTDGDLGQVLKTDGSGSVTWGTVTGGGGATYSPAEFDQYRYTVSANGAQSFSGPDDFGETLDYSDGNISVFLNGVLQAANVDYLASNTTSVWFTEGVANGDIVQVQSWKKISAYVEVDSSIIGNTTIGTTSGTDIVADQFRKESIRTAKYLVQVSDPNHNNSYQATEVFLIHNGSATFMTEYGTVKTGGAIANVSSTIDGNYVQLLVTPSVANAEVKVVRTGVNV